MRTKMKVIIGNWLLKLFIWVTDAKRVRVKY